MTDPELLDHVATAPRWKEYLYHVGSSFTVKSILQAGLIAGEKDATEGRWTVSFTPFRPPMGDETEGEYEDLTKPRKVLYKAIYWVNLGKAQDQGIQFWQSRSHTIFFYDSVPAGCIEKVVSTTGDKILFRRIPAPRPPPKVVLKNGWQVQHDKPSSNEQSCAERDLFKIDLSVQEVPQNAVLEDQGRVTKSQDADLKKAREFNTYSDEPKKTVQQLGKIDKFVLGEVSTKKKTVLVLRQALPRRTEILYLRKMFKTIERTDSQDEGKI